MNKWVLNAKGLSAIQKGRVLIKSDMLADGVVDDGAVVRVESVKRQFLGLAICSQQNKQIGLLYTTTEQPFDERYIAEKIQVAYEKRQKEKQYRDTNAYRLFNAESDGIPGLTIDVYDDTAVLSWYSQGMYTHATMVYDRLLALPSINELYEKLRYQDAPFDSRFVSGVQKEELTIVENGVQYVTYMNDGLMTGIFLDQRDVRAYVKAHATRQSVLNTFSYTGAFSVAAAAGGAKQTVSVDVAKRSLALTTANFEANGIDMAMHQLYVMDVFDYFKYAQKKALTFDWVILDPPSFARTKKRVFSVLKNYGELLADAIAITAKQGRIVVSTNHSEYSLRAFEEMIAKTFKQIGRRYTIEKIFRQPNDFTHLNHSPETQYLKVVIVKVLD